MSGPIDGDNFAPLGVAHPAAASGSSCLVAAMLERVVVALEAHPALARRLAAALGIPGAPAGGYQEEKFMTIEEYAKHAKVSPRTIRRQIKDEMEEGLHFHRAGRKVTIHVQQADEWRMSRRPRARAANQDFVDFVDDELLRRRAQVALAKVRKSK